MSYMILEVREHPEYLERAIDYFSACWGIDRRVYEDSIGHSLTTESPLPRWYLMINEADEIVGSYGLIVNDFVSRQDIWPYLCGLHIGEGERGKALGSRLLEHGRREAHKLGFPKVYLVTDHVGYYEKYGFAYMGITYSAFGDSGRIYWADSIPGDTLEDMAGFFTARVEGYDSHMLTNVEGCKEGYEEMARQVPESCKSLLDLGCGTGLELDAIFKRLPNLAVTGIDLTEAMLQRLQEKHPDKRLNLICGSYFDVEFGEEQFDCAVSFQTMHHFTHEEKLGLYTRIQRAVKPGCPYIECDYMVLEQREEDFYYAENARIRREQGIAPGAFYHYDTPCTVENQINLLLAAGFREVRQVYRRENTTMLAAWK